MTFRQRFCKHVFRIIDASFPSNAWITPQTSDGLAHTDHYWKEREQKWVTYQVVNTFYTKTSGIYTLYGKRCQKCGLVTSCSGFEAEQYRQDHRIMLIEGLCGDEN